MTHQIAGDSNSKLSFSPLLNLNKSTSHFLSIHNASDHFLSWTPSPGLTTTPTTTFLHKTAQTWCNSTSLISNKYFSIANHHKTAYRAVPKKQTSHINSYEFFFRMPIYTNFVHCLKLSNKYTLFSCLPPLLIREKYPLCSKTIYSVLHDLCIRITKNQV